MREQLWIAFDPRVEPHLAEQSIDVRGGAIARRRPTHARTKRYQIAHIAAQTIERYLTRKGLFGRVRRPNAVLTAVDGDR